MKNRIVWGDSWRFPYKYGFCPNEKAWAYMCKHAKLNKRDYPTSAGSTNLFVTRPDKMPCAVVTITGSRTPQQIAELLAHEAMHVWRDMRKVLGEKKPSSEFEAYSIMIIFGELLNAYQQTRGGLFVRRKTKPLSPSK